MQKIHNQKGIVEILLLILGIGFLLFFNSGSSLKNLKPNLKNQNTENTQNTEKNTYKVVRVIDGDTIEIETGETVRYIGIDTPEKDSEITKAECFNKESTNFNKSLVLGKEVSLKKDKGNTDKYGRLLRYVYVGDTFVNKELVEKGYALAKSYPPNTSENSTLFSAQDYAKENNLGLWGECN